MSGQIGSTPCRVPKTPPNSGKGPLKATIPISSVMKQSGNVKEAVSPTPGPPISPFSWKSRTSPDHASGQRSPGSSTYKGKSKYSGGPSEVMRRTASLDTIYLKGHWPRDHFYWGHMGTLQIDKATQTDDNDWSDIRKIQCISESDDNCTLKPKIRGYRDSSGRHISPGENTLNSSSQTLALKFSASIISPTLKPLTIPVKPIPRSSIRSSVEGLNQEIERIVLRTGDDGLLNDRNELFRQITPEGHRAPLAEILRFSRSRSVNTQTPQDFSHSSGSSSRESFSPPMFRGRSRDSESSNEGESHGSSPDNEASKLGTSPQINKFLAREPPDGCEKVRLKSLDEKTSILLEHAPQPSTFKLKPSLGSAFKILQPALSPSEEQVEPPGCQD
ncbi:protein FAM117B-like isoform X1 [Euwallacea similis]|uniref:protein FAM117B-like isoform X1 n=1 Tax=Euwallacea similis TaxID=1736056 RepID=UPI00344DA65F